MSDFREFGDLRRPNRLSRAATVPPARTPRASPAGAETGDSLGAPVTLFDLMATATSTSLLTHSMRTAAGSRIFGLAKLGYGHVPVRASAHRSATTNESSTRLLTPRRSRGHPPPARRPPRSPPARRAEPCARRQHQGGRVVQPGGGDRHCITAAPCSPSSFSSPSSYSSPSSFSSSSMSEVSGRQTSWNRAVGSTVVGAPGLTGGATEEVLRVGQSFREHRHDFARIW